MATTPNDPNAYFPQISIFLAGPVMLRTVGHGSPLSAPFFDAAGKTLALGPTSALASRVETKGI